MFCCRGLVAAMKRILIVFFIILDLTIMCAIAYGDQVTLVWEPRGQAPEGYRIYMRTFGRYDFDHPVWPTDGKDHTETTCTITNLNPGVTYHFVARAYAGNEQSENSNEVTYTAKGNAP